MGQTLLDGEAEDIYRRQLYGWVGRQCRLEDGVQVPLHNS